MTTKLERAFLNLSHGHAPSHPLDHAHDSAQASHTSHRSGLGDGDNGDGGSGLAEDSNGSGKGADLNGSDGKGGKPAGGYDDTPLPPTPGPVYTVEITFHRATHLPITDLPSFSSDPYVLATLTTSLPTRHKEDPPIRFRTRTIHSDLNPSWEERWILSGVPESGFELKCKIFDEDKADHDDRLGVAFVHVPKVGGEGWVDIKDQAYEVHKKRSSQRANLSRVFTRVFNPGAHRRASLAETTDAQGNILTAGEHYESLHLSIRLLHPTPPDLNLGKVYTVGPNYFRIHFSPMIGRLMGVKGGDGQGDGDGLEGGGKGKEVGGVEKYDFQTNELQLPGPVPNELYHRYVDFSSFVNGMFNSTGLRGRLLNKALHHQHARLYNFDSRTVYGSFDGPGEEMTRRFLEMAHFDAGGRIFTYVVTSDAMMRFTETGKEFGIDLLSKHTMHSDVNIYIAWSGEFLIRRRRRPQDDSPHASDTHGPDSIPGGPPNAPPPRDVRLYELIIDNDSGTYRPNADLIPIFKSFMERSLPGLHVRVYNGFDKDLERIKDEQREIKKKEGEGKVYYQDGLTDHGEDSVSSSDEEALGEHRATLQRQQEGGEGMAGGNTGLGQQSGGGKLAKGVAFLEEPKTAFKNKF